MSCRRCWKTHIQRHALMLEVRSPLVRHSTPMLHLCTLRETRKWLGVEEPNLKQSGLQIRTYLRTIRTTTTHQRKRILPQSRDLEILNPLLRHRCADIIPSFETRLRGLLASFRRRCRSLAARASMVSAVVHPKSGMCSTLRRQIRLCSFKYNYIVHLEMTVRLLCYSSDVAATKSSLLVRVSLPAVLTQPN